MIEHDSPVGLFDELRRAFDALVYSRTLAAVGMVGGFAVCGLSVSNASAEASSKAQRPICDRGRDVHYVAPATGTVYAGTSTCRMKIDKPEGNKNPKATAVIVAAAAFMSGPEAPDSPMFAKRAERLAKEGYFVRTVEIPAFNIDGDTGHGPDSLHKTVKWYDYVRRASDSRFGKGHAVCLFGDSSGAHAVLYAATRRKRKPDCIVARGTPTNLPLLHNPETLALAQAAFGPDRLKKYSPTSYKGNRFPSTLLETLPDDQVVDKQQTYAFARKHRSVRSFTFEVTGPDAPECQLSRAQLATNGRDAPHTCDPAQPGAPEQQGVTLESMAASQRAELSLLQRAAKHARREAQDRKRRSSRRSKSD